MNTFDISNIIFVVVIILLAYVAVIRPVVIKSGLTDRNKHVAQGIEIADSLAKGIITNYSVVTSLTGSQKKKEAADDLMNRIKNEPGIDISQQTALERIQVAYNKKKQEEEQQSQDSSNSN